MTEPTLLSENQLPIVEATASNENLPKLPNVAMNLSAIPVLRPSTKEPLQETSPTEPVSLDDGKLEYEFTNLWQGCLYCVHLYDTDDLSACERVLNRPVKPEELSYSNTGNGFIVDDEFKFTFKKAPFQRTFTNIRVKEAPQGMSAEDILASL